MKHKLATIPAVVAALTVSALAVHTSAGAAPRQPAAPPTWNLEAYGPRATDNVVLKWNEQLLDTIRKNPGATGPTVTSRALGILQTAVYDAWAAYDAKAKGTRLGSQLRRPAGERTEANKSKAISYAAYRVLTDLFGGPLPNSPVPAYQAQMAALGYPVDTTVMDSSPAGIGNRAAKALLDYRHADGSNQLNGYADYTGYQPKNSWDKVTYPMLWQPLCVLTDAGVAAGKPQVPTGSCEAPYYVVQKAATPQWGRIVPFATPVAGMWVSGPPKNPDGTYSTTELDRQIADSADLDDREKSQAEYWADGPKSEFPPGHCFVFAQAMARKNNYSLDQTVKMFFPLGNAVMDAGIVAWSIKYKYDSIRPTSAIRNQRKGQLVRSWLGPNQGFGWVDGSQWLPYQHVTVLTPPFPEYTSGHSTFSSAGARVMQTFLGSDTFGAYVTIEANSSKFEANTPATDVVFTWPTFTSTLDDAGFSRRIGGIHFLSGDAHGRATGTQIGMYVWNKAQQYVNGTTPG